MYRQSSFSQLPEIVKNLLIINGLFFLAKMTLASEIDMDKLFALHPFQSPDFEPYQLITHMFMHADFTHLFFNMLAIWMFGKVLENVWGGKRFLIYYIVTGLGAMILYSIVQHIQISALEAKMTIEQIQHVASDEGYDCYKKIVELSKSEKGLNEYGYSLYGIKGAEMKGLLSLYYFPVLGASGALFGILLAFGMLFPNTRLHLFASFLILISFEIIFSISLPIFNIFIILLIISKIVPNLNYYIWHTIPIKAKYFAIIYGALELYLGFISTPDDNVAHFAHLGGMLFGFILLKYWQKNNTQFY